MRITILGKRWALKFVPNLGEDRGNIDGPHKTHKAIRIWQGLKDQERLEVLIHEMMHAAGWHLEEEYVEEFADDLSRILWRLGYRGPNDDSPAKSE
jgi:hypothetical protein